MYTSKWTVQFEDNPALGIANLKEFCTEKGLSYTALINVARGKQSAHRGWTCERDEGPRRISSETQNSVAPEETAAKQIPTELAVAPEEPASKRIPMEIVPDDASLPIRTLYEKYVGPFSDAGRIEEIHSIIRTCCSKCTGSLAHIRPDQCENPSCVLFAYLGVDNLPPDFQPSELTELVMDFCSNACEDRIEPFRSCDICAAELCKFYSYRGSGRAQYIEGMQLTRLVAKLKSLEKIFHTETGPVIAAKGTETICPYFGTDYDEKEVACQECMQVAACVQKTSQALRETRAA